MKSLAITAAVAVPTALAYDAWELHRDGEWGDLGGFAGNLVVGGGATVATFAAAGLAALVPATRVAARPLAGVGVGLLGATAVGMGAIVAHERLRSTPTLA